MTSAFNTAYDTYLQEPVDMVVLWFHMGDRGRVLLKRLLYAAYMLGRIGALTTCCMSSAPRGH